MSNPIVRDLVARSIASHSPNTFRPTPDHRRAKSAYWAHYFDKGEIPPTVIDEANAARISGYNEVIQWFSELQGFREWFSNGEEFRQQVEYVAHLGLSVIEEVLLNGDARNSDRLQAAKMALEIAAKFPSRKGEAAVADERIREMDRKELEEFIASKLHVLPTPEK